MRLFLTVLLRCVLVLGLGFTPVANAVSMAALDSHPADAPPCHMPSHAQQKPDGKCCVASTQCHCAMAIVLPTVPATIATPRQQADHPQTVRLLALAQAVIPDTPPPRLSP
jgi:hypothetical protein